MVENPMTIEQIMTELEFLEEGEFPSEALASAMAQREAITPALLEVLEDPRNLLARLRSEASYMAPIYAMYVLAYFREPRAYPLIVDIFSIPGEEVVDLTGDLVTEDLARILASVAHEDAAPLKAMIENPELSPWVRDAAIRALVILVLEEELSRDELEAYFQGLFHGGLEDESGIVWSNLVIAAAELQFTALRKEIERAFQQDLVDTWVIDEDYAEQIMASDPEQQQEELRQDVHKQLIGNVIEELSWWACFKEKPEPRREPKSLPPSPPLPTQSDPHEPYVAPVKVGRNDPCPCGSGKKYKYCCGKRH